MDEYLTPDELAAKVKVRPHAVREWLKSGQLQGAKLGRIWRIPLSEAERFMTSALVRVMKTSPEE